MFTSDFRSSQAPRTAVASLCLLALLFVALWTGCGASPTPVVQKLGGGSTGAGGGSVGGGGGGGGVGGGGGGGGGNPAAGDQNDPAGPPPPIQIAAAPNPIGFGNQGVNTTSAAQTIQVTNPASSASAVKIQGVVIAPAQFAFVTPPGIVTLQPGQSASYSVTFAPNSVAAFAGGATFNSDVGGSITVALSGTGIGAPVPTASIAPSPASLSFGPNALTVPSPAQTVTITNTTATGGPSLTVSAPAIIPAEFLVSPTTPVTLAPGASQVYNVTFTADLDQAFFGALTFTTNSGSGILTVALSGSGPTATPFITVAPVSVTFATQGVGTTSSPQTVTLTNTGASSAQVLTMAASPSQFTVSGPSTPFTIAAGASVPVTVSFAPDSAQTFNGALTFTTDHSTGPTNVPLSGTGASATQTIIPASINFGVQATTLSSAPRPVVIKNTSVAGLNVVINSVTSSSPNFPVSGPATPVTLTPGQTATYNVVFSPDQSQNYSGTLSITTSAVVGTTAVPLSGVGALPQLTISPSPTNFGTQQVGTTSAAKILTVSNTSTNGLPLQIVAASASPSQFVVTSGPPLPLILNVGQSANFNVTFTPTVGVTYSGFFTATTNPAVGVPAAALNGQGVPAKGSPNPTISLLPSLINFGVQGINSTSSHIPVTLTNTSTTANLSVASFSIAPSVFSVSGLNPPFTLTPGQNTTLTLTFTPNAAQLFNGTLTLSDNTLNGSDTLALSGTGSSVSGLTAQAPYTAINDRVLRPALVPPPALGAAGFLFTDPEFGARMVRVTDPNTRPDRVNETYSTPAAAEQNTFNTSSTLFYVTGVGGEVIPYSLNPTTMAVARIPTGNMQSGGLLVPLRAAPSFSYTDPDLMFGTSNTAPPVFQSFRFSNQIVATFHDPSTCVTVPAGSFGNDLTISSDDSRFGTYFGGATADQHFVLYVFDKNLGCRFLNTLTGQISGNWGPTGQAVYSSPLPGFHMHNARLSRDGKFLRATPAVADKLNVIIFWDVATLNVSVCPTTGTTSCEGHMVSTGYELINQLGKGDGVQFPLRAFTNLTSLQNLISPLLTPSEFVQDTHPSWNNALPSILVPFCTSLYRIDSTPIVRPWDDEVICVRTDTVQSEVWRFAHTRGSNTTFDTRPRGNVSQDGHFFTFSTDWMGTLGTNRTDVFLVELK